jgi:glycine/D-amino acid oxidase-like deaminating enzyme
MTAGYLKLAISRGARLYAPDTIVDVANSGKGVEAHSEKGRIYRAASMVYASGYEMPKAITPPSLRVSSTWALATRPQPRRLWPEEAFIWEASDPYLYVRTTPDGRILCGGEDEEVADDEARDALAPKKIERIRRKLRKLLPDADDRPATSWSAFFGSSATGLAQIGRVPGHPRLYAAMGYGGNGITFSRIAAEILTSALAGRRDSDADVFAIDGAKGSKTR